MSAVVVLAAAGCQTIDLPTVADSPAAPRPVIARADDGKTQAARINGVPLLGDPYGSRTISMVGTGKFTNDQPVPFPQPA